MTSILVVERSADEPDSSSTDETFVIEREYTNIDSEEYDKWYRILSNAAVETATTVPVYDISLQHIIMGRHGRLHELTLLGVLFRRYLEQFDAPTIVCHGGLDEGYQTVISEVGEAAGCDVEGVSYRRSTLDNIGHVLLTSVLILPFLIDQLLAVFLYRFRSRPETPDTVLIPALGRLGSMLPVIDTADFDTQVIISANASSLWSTLTTTELRQYNPIPVSAYSSVGCVFQQLRSYLRITYSVLVDQEILTALSTALEREGEYPLTETIQYSVWNAFGPRMFVSFFKYILFRRMISQTGAQKVVVGTHDPGGIATEHAAIDEDSTPFHIPHSIGTYNSPNPPSDVVQFVSGQTEKQYRIESPQIEDQWTYRVTGRPYLIDIYNRRSEFEREPSDNPRLLIATQPISYNKEFVREVLEATVADRKQWQVTLKIHPNEEPSNYAEFTADFSHVTIQESDLFQHLVNADLTVTINSNVGVESIILGTPTVVLNMSKPVNLDPVYAIEGPIQSFESGASFRQFILETDEDDLLELKQQQFEWVKENYKLESDPTEQILRNIEQYSA